MCSFPNIYKEVLGSDKQHSKWRASTKHVLSKYKFTIKQHFFSLSDQDATENFEFYLILGLIFGFIFKVFIAEQFSIIPHKNGETIMKPNKF